MEIIDNVTVRVDDFNELSSFVSTNNEFTYIYLGNDIVMTSGIQIYNNKTLLVIDGEYPEGSGIIRKITDTGGNFGMIYKENISSLDITFKNMVIEGRNYYGMPRIANGNIDVSVTYQKVTYTGPQITWHWSGLTRYIDCNITTLYANHSPMHEVAEICKLEIGGKTTIRHTPNNTFAVFRFYNSNASLTILEDADVDITTNNDFLYHEFPPQFVIQKCASLKITTRKGISRSYIFRFSSFFIATEASFIHIQNSDSDDTASLYIDGAFTVSKGARVYMEANYTGSAGKRLVQFSSTSSATKGLYLDKPKSFVLYKRGPGTAIYFAASSQLVFNTEQVNFWRDAELIPIAGTFDDFPLHRWHNPDWSGFEIIGNAVSNATTITSTTLAQPIEPPLSNLKLHEARVFSAGYLPLEINPIVNDITPITGTSDPNANIKVMYTDQETHTILDIADETGFYSITTPAPIFIDTPVEVSANVPFLYISLIKNVEEVGELFIESAPIFIIFTVPSISTPSTCILGRTSNENVVVVDNRAYRTEWELVVSIDRNMDCQESGRSLSGKVIFVPENSTFDDEKPIEPSMFVRVYTGGPNDDRLLIKWESKAGILLHVTGPVNLGDVYRANLIWEVRPLI